MPQSFPFGWPAPTGWKTETIPFPLEFAPALKYTGVEELRFSPGFGDAKSPLYFAYAFVWVVEADAVPSREQLERDLAAYFEGLMQAVAKSKKQDPPAKPARCTLAPMTGAPVPAAAPLRLEPLHRGTIETFDSFFARRELSLECAIFAVRPDLAYRQAIYFEVAPKLSDPAVHAEMEKLRRALGVK
jgi:hypothetical protein